MDNVKLYAIDQDGNVLDIEDCQLFTLSLQQRDILDGMNSDHRLDAARSMTAASPLGSSYRLD